MTPSCHYVHEYRTCEDEANGFICRYMKAGPGGGGGYWKRKKIHGCKRVHERVLGRCGKVEWEVRCVVAGLRVAHGEGRY